MGQRVVLGAHALHLLNPTAALIWTSWEECGCEELCASRLAEHYGLSLARARNDVAHALGQWRGCGLLGPRTEGSGVEPFPPHPPAAIDDSPPPWPAAYEQAYRLGNRCWLLRCHDTHVPRLLTPLLGGLDACPRTGIPQASTFSLGPGPEGLTLWRGGAVLACGLATPRAIQTLLFELGEWCYRMHDWRVVLHAAGVHDGRRALVLPALGGTGKTTLAAALLGVGCGHLNDDLVPLVGPGLRALAVPLPLRIKPGAVPLLADTYPGLRDLTALPPDGVRLLLPPGPGRRPASCAVAALVFPERACEPVASCHLEAISPVTALERLLATNALLHRPLIGAHVEDLLGWLTRTPAYRLRYRELAPAVSCLRARLDCRTTVVEPGGGR